MEENQTKQNLNQQPVQPQQPVQLQPEQVQQPVQNQQVQQQTVQGQQQPAEQPSVSMQIQQLLVQQQQYQQQYNQLVDYVKKTPGLPIDQVNQIKAQLDQLNALFVEGKQKLQALGYNQVQVNKPTEVKRGAKFNLSFKKLAIGCGLIVVLLLAGLFATLFSLQKNPSALLSLGIETDTAKSLLMAFFGLLFGSIIILMVGVIISNVYRLITVKNQSKTRFIFGLIGGVFGASIIGVVMGLIFGEINKIVPEVKQPRSYLVQPYLIGLSDKDGKRSGFLYDVNDPQYKYPLIAPAEIGFEAIGSDIRSKLGSNVKIESVVLVCGNKQGQKLDLTVNGLAQVQNGGVGAFDGTCLYAEKGTYKYSIEVTYENNISHEKHLKTTMSVDKTKDLNFESEIIISKNSNRMYPSNGEFNLGQAPAKITTDSNKIFSDFGLGVYNLTWDMDGDKNVDRENQVTFDYSYRIPKVYYPSVKFPDLKSKYPLVKGFEFIYTFPVRITPSDIPVCYFELTRFDNTKYQISTQFTDPADAAKISSYQYTIRNSGTKTNHEVLKDAPQEINYTFPEQGNYIVILDYVTIDGKAGRCESDIVQMEKEKFKVSYTLLAKESDSQKMKELCNSSSSAYSKCRQINLEVVPKTYQLQIKSISPYSNTTKKAVFLNDKPILNENDTYTFDIPDEGTYELIIVTSDEVRGMEEETIEIKFVADKPDIVGNMTVTSADTRQPISEGFEPLTVIIDASKTEVNVEGDEIIYFTWDFGDGEIRRNVQNGVVAHTYNYDYDRENGIFTPKVTVKTRSGLEKMITGPTVNVKKGLISVDITSTSHPTRQAPTGKEVTFAAEFDGLPEKMIWDFGDGSPTTTCKGRNCTEVTHTFTTAGVYSIKLSLEFDAVQQVDGTMDFKAY